MTQEELKKAIELISSSFETKPYTDNVKLLKEDFDMCSLNSPKYYINALDEMNEILRQTRLLFIIAVLNKVCQEEGKLYYFDTPYQASMSYSAVMKKEDSFYLLDEDGDYTEIFTSERFATFIDDQYWELY